ncbi:MAG: hypothetical protein II561_07105, partial [Thermoguttaceae bacterium]|nr:hypothetical protein [Thermoguttaceae bacterium]
IKSYQIKVYNKTNTRPFATVPIVAQISPEVNRALPKTQKYPPLSIRGGEIFYRNRKSDFFARISTCF